MTYLRNIDASRAPWRTRLLAGCVALLTTLGTQANGLPPPVRAALDAQKLSERAISIYVRDVDAEQPLIAHRALTPRNPASVMKLVTTFAALDVLGAGYHWLTRVYAVGTITGDRLDGDLYIKGGGDPYLVSESLWRMLRALRQQGLREIAGDLVIDGSRFDVDEGDPGAFDGEPYRAYNQFPRALLFSFNATRFHLWPALAEPKVIVSLEPPSDTIRVHNQLRLTKGRCRGLHRQVRMAVTPRPDGATVRLSGDYPRACGPHQLLRSVVSPETHAFGSFTALWRELGGTFRGGLRRARVPKGARSLLVWQSEPLADVIQSVNKHSNNVMSRQLLVTLGMAVEGSPGTVYKGRRAVEAWMRESGFFPEALFVDNGAGLSRTASVTADSLGKMLIAAHRHPLMPEFVASLPLAGVDGTMRRRFKGEALAGRAHLKTGLIRHVRSIGGYHLSRSGRTYVVVVLHNEPDVHMGGGTRVQDALLTWLHER